MIQTEKYKKCVSIEHLNISDFSINSQLTILFVLAGNVELVVNGKNRTVGLGEIFILNKGDLVSIPIEKKNSVLTVVIEKEFYHNESRTFQLNHPLSFIYMKETYEQIAKMLAAVYVETLYGKEGFNYMIESYFKKIYGLLIRYIPASKEVDDSLPNDSSRKIKEVISYINENYSEKIQLDTLADVFYVNKYYLVHLFKEQLDMTIGSYIKIVRLSHSEKDLLNSNKKIMEVALQNGFPNAKSLTHAFKEKHGMTPSRYRKEIENSQNTFFAKEDSETNLELLSHFIQEEDIKIVQQSNIKRFEKTVNMNKAVFKNKKRDYVVKMKSDNLDKLASLKEIKGIHYVSIHNIFSLIDISYDESELTVFFHQLDKRLNTIIKNGYIPYIQLQAIDYERWMKDYDFSTDNIFSELVSQLNTHFDSEYSSYSTWYVEFRCFHETDKNPSLCVPLYESISLFKRYSNLMVHFPVFPTDARDYSGNERADVYCINDFTEVKVIEFEKVLTNLKEDKYIEVIKEQNNPEVQKNLFQRIDEYEKDAYLSSYSGLIQAVVSIWNFIRTKQQTSHYISPLLFDGTEPFKYFPVELAKRFSLFTKEGLITENWYAHKFINDLYSDVVFRNEYIIITKHHENYNLLMLYPEEEVLYYLDRKKGTKSFIFEKNSKQPYIQLDLLLTGLSGTYKIIRHSINREIIDQKPEAKEIKASNYLSIEDISYYNSVYCPSRSITEEVIDKDYTFKANIPILGVSFVEFKKIK